MRRMPPHTDSKETRAWWTDGSTTNFQPTMNRVALNLQFSNGQQVAIVSSGLIGIHKPTVAWGAGLYKPGVPHGHRSSLGVLSVGIGEFYGDPKNGRLNWDATSRLLGEAKWIKGGIFATVQLLKRDTSCPQETWTDWRLDNALPYNITSYYDHPEDEGAFFRAEVTDSDAPTDYMSFWISWGIPFRPAYMTDQFQQFFMYRPETANSIWVTLGESEWNWHGRVVSSDSEAGWEWFDDPFCYHSQTIVPSTRFPEWQLRKTNIE